MRELFTDTKTIFFYLHLKLLISQFSFNILLWDFWSQPKVATRETEAFENCYEATDSFLLSIFSYWVDHSKIDIKHTQPQTAFTYYMENWTFGPAGLDNTK